MDGVIDGAGDVAPGTLLAREAERTHAPGHDPSLNCANCKAVLVGPFCAVCGQHGHVHRTAGALFHDIAHGVFHFDGKLATTLPLLAWRPGALTRRYIDGERAKFVSPVALFLFSVFLMFAVVANLPGWTVPESLTHTTDISAEFATERLRLDNRLSRQTRELALRREHVGTSEVAAKERAIAATRRKLAEVVKLQAALPALDEATNTGIERINSNASWVQARIDEAAKNPKLLFYKMKTSAYKFSWALIPISLPFIWLLFPFRRDVGLYDHAVFATYSLSFMSLLVVVVALLGAVGVSEAVLGWATLIPPLHLYSQLRGGYRLGRAGAMWRTAVLLVFTSITLAMFTLLLLWLGTVD
jgi:hypothetical protein